MKTYYLVILIAFLSALRDAGSEVLMKGKAESFSPFLLLFCFSAGAYLFMTPIRWKSFSHHYSDFVKNRTDLFLVNIYTCISFIATYIALSSEIGGGIISFIDYGLTPFAVVIVGWAMMKEKLSSSFWVAFPLCFSGVLIFAVQRISLDDIQLSNLSGIFWAMTSSLFAALCIFHYKKLINKGMKKIDILFGRLALLLLLTFVFSFSEIQKVPLTELFLLITVGGLLFLIPFLLILEMIKRSKVQDVSIFLFLAPVLTVIFSTFLGHTFLLPFDYLSLAIILGTIILFESGKIDSLLNLLNTNSKA